MSALGDREDDIRDLLNKWGLNDERYDEAYKLLVELHELRDKLYTFKNCKLIAAYGSYEANTEEILERGGEPIAQFVMPSVPPKGNIEEWGREVVDALNKITNLVDEA